jgi:hypothetical protein
MESIQSLEDPDPVQSYYLHRARIKEIIVCVVVVAVLLVGYFGIYR